MLVAHQTEHLYANRQIKNGALNRIMAYQPRTYPAIIYRETTTLGIKVFSS